MLIRLLKAERLKLRRSPVWLAFLLMPVLPAILGTLNYLGNIEILSSEWYSLWTQHTLFTDYFFLPIMLGIYCSYIMHQEHLNHNWNKLFSMPVGRANIFLAKLISASGMVLLSEAWIGALFLISGYVLGMSDPPLGSLAIWCLFGTLGGVVMAAIQLTLSMFIKSFALPVGIAFAGGLSGLVFLSKHLGHVWPYSLMAYGMNSNSPQELIKSGYAQFVIICMVYIALFTIFGSVVASRKEMG